MRGRDIVVAQGLLHVLVHFTVQGVEDVTSRTAHEVREAFAKERKGSVRASKPGPSPGGPVVKTAFQGRG